MKKSSLYKLNALVALLVLLAGAGCDLSSSDDASELVSEAVNSLNESTEATSSGTTPAPVPSGSGADEINASSVVWLDADVSGWAQTATLNAGVSAGIVRLAYDKARVWPTTSTRASDGGPLIGNCWVIVNQGGTWYGATWDWMRPGQQAKARGALTGRNGHIQRAPLNSWSPSSGEQIGLMVSTPGRTGERTINERSNIDLVTVP